MAPHRVTLTQLCPIRRTDRCEPMTMREIQDMSVNTARGLERLERQLEARSRYFKEREMQVIWSVGPGIPRAVDEACIGLRLTAAPVVDMVSINPVFHQGAIVEALAPRHWAVQWQRQPESGSLLSQLFFSNRNWKPKLRAARVASESPGPVSRTNYRKFYGELHCDGLVELGYISNGRLSPETGMETVLCEGWFISWIPNLLAWADQVRAQAHAPTAEYVLEVEVMVLGHPCFIHAGLEGLERPLSSSRLSSPPRSQNIPPSTVKFPLYPFHQVTDIGRVTSLFRRDLWHWIGQDLSIDETFSLVGLETVA